MFVLGEDRRRILPAFVLLSPVLPLPVEFVAGGEGKPEPLDPPGLGGSGKSGILAENEEDGEEPRKMADKGRLCLKEGRGVIGRSNPCVSHQA